MNGFALVLVAATLGVDYGWQPSSDGRLEYVIQVEPVTLIALREGQEVLSQIDPYVRNVRRFRIRVGSDLVPRVGSPPRDGGYGSTPTRPLPVQAGVTYGWQPLDAKSLEFIVQISPERLVLLKSGEDIVGEIPPEVQHVARIRVRSASDQLPRQGMTPATGQSSGVALASANQPSPNSPSAGQPTNTPHFTASNPTNQAGGAPQLGNAAGAANTAPQLGSGPTVGSPPRFGVSGSNATGTPATAQGYTPAGGFSSRANQNQPPSGQTTYSGPSTSGWGAPTVGADQSDSRFIYEQTRGRFSESTNVPPTQRASVGQGSGWQQPAVQPIAQPSYPVSPPPIRATQPPAPTVASNSGGWSGSVGNTQSPGGAAEWPPRLREEPPNAAQANQGGWGARPTASSPQNYPTGQYGGGQYASGQSTTSHDHLAPAGGPIYASNPPSSPYGSAEQAPGIASRPPSGPGGGFSPYSSPTFQPSHGQSRPGNQGLGSDLDWPLNTVSFGVPSEQKANPLDFWNALDETASDPSLAYLSYGGTSGAEEAWWPLTLAMLALFASMGGNLYMGWIAVDVYRKYLDVATDGYDDEGDDDNDYERSRRSRTDEDEEEGWGDRRRRRERTPVGSDY